ncbi:MAG: iron-containing alcohol dehydrogenase [Leptospiraceae bacterium]|nr:iron-containing alcohol dehydrogenase [Leptospiraceae bacterium]
MGYKNIAWVLKETAKILPFPKPTLFSGPGSSIELCRAISKMGTKKIFIVTDETLVKIGILKNILTALEENGVAYEIYDKILPDPTYDQVENGLEILKNTNCDAILAIGGGSPIDAAKVLAARATNDKSIAQLAGLFKVWNAIMPLYVIPTTAGTGSEATVAAVVSDPVTHAKTPLMDPKLVPSMAALDGELMIGLPAGVTTATGMDALTHAVEAFISSNALPDTDRHSLAAAKLIDENLREVVKNPGNVQARQNMALASYFAGLAFTRAGVGYVHAIAHNFGALYKTPHGLANAIVLPYVLEFSLDSASDRLAKLAETCGLKQNGDSEIVLAKKFIQYVIDLKKEFGIPDKLKDLKKEDIPKIAKAALKEAHFTYAVPKYMDQTTCENLVAKMLP